MHRLILPDDPPPCWRRPACPECGHLPPGPGPWFCDVLFCAHRLRFD